MFMMIIWIATTVATYIIATRNELDKPHLLAMGNLILPLLGLLYVLYIAYIYIPRREGRIPPVLIFLRVFFEEIAKSYKEWRAGSKSNHTKP